MRQPVAISSQKSAPIVEAMPLPEVDATGGARQAVSRESLLAAEASQGLCASDNILDEMFSQPCLAGVYLEEEERLAFNQLL